MKQLTNTANELVTSSNFFDDPVHQTWHYVYVPNSSYRKNFPGLMPSRCLPIIRAWCDAIESDYRYYSQAGRFYFEDEGDATIFALRWL